jgi:hypothetical protein
LRIRHVEWCVANVETVRYEGLLGYIMVIWFAGDLTGSLM